MACVVFFHPARANMGRDAHVGLLHSLAAQTLDIGAISLSSYWNISNDAEYVLFPQQAARRPLLLTTRLQGAYGATEFMDIGMSIPFHADKSGFNESLEANALGDISVSTKIQYPQHLKERLFTQSFWARATFPTGTKGKGVFPRHIYRYSDKVDTLFHTDAHFSIEPLMLWSLNLMKLKKLKLPLFVHMNYGARFSFNRNLPNAFYGTASLTYRPSAILDIFFELTTETKLEKIVNMSRLPEDPIFISPGLAINMPSGLVANFAYNKSIMSKNATTFDFDHAGVAYSTKAIPNWSVSFTMGWRYRITKMDTDRDGVANRTDRCVTLAEDIDGFNDRDGCPDNDNDNDGIPDSADQCPNEPEDLDGLVDEDGCPEEDHDKDGVLDSADRCKTVPEDPDGFQDNDGCPDPDNDADGIADSADSCRNDPEDPDGFNDDDGCPDLDNDGDNIPDSLDKCPNKPETRNGYNDKDGCPDGRPAAKEIKRGRMVLKGVTFVMGEATLTRGSFSTLNRLAKSLQAYPDVKIEIHAYMDNTLKADEALELSRKRGDRIKAYLIEKGIDASRMTAIGLGANTPIASNHTASGRAKNRRIEVLRTD